MACHCSADGVKTQRTAAVRLLWELKPCTALAKRQAALIFPILSAARCEWQSMLGRAGFLDEHLFLL